MFTRTRNALVLAATLLAMPTAFSQGDGGWQACTAQSDGAARLACFDAWARAQGAPAAVDVPAAVPAAAGAQAQAEEENGCHDPAASELSRSWELERRTSCGTFGLRGYRPLSLSLVTANTVNRQPTSENPANSAGGPQAYRTFETRIQLSVRSKLAEGLLRRGDAQDSLWFGYSQQSYWQLFTRELSRPFRSTDHEPELFYVLPIDQPIGDSGWRVRYGGVGIVHQSNGQSLPYSRSWNRAYLMAGAERPGGITLQGRLWKRLPEDAAGDDNPRISDYIGRAELMAGWASERGQRWYFTWRTPLDRIDRGSARLQWLVPVRSPSSGTRFGNLNVHTQVFTGYGDSLLDYNRARTTLSVGLSLFDW